MYPILLADNDSNFLTSVSRECRVGMNKPIFATTALEAETIILDQSQIFSGNFINRALESSGMKSLVGLSHQFKPGIPIYLLTDSTSTYNEGEIRSLGIQQVLAKPITYTEMLLLISPTAIFLQYAQHYLKKNKATDVPPVYSGKEDPLYVAVKSIHFLIQAKSVFDVYARLDSGRFFLIIQAGDTLEPEKILEYIKKGLSWLYVKKSAQMNYLEYCNCFTQEVLKNPKSSLEVKLAKTLTQGEETVDFLNNVGINKENIRLAQNYVERTKELVAQLHPERYPQLQSFLSFLPAYEHGVATTLIASLIMQEMGIDSESSLKDLGLACMFHDISLLDSPTLIHEDESQMSPDQYEIFKKHPFRSYEILKSIQGISELALEAVLQHHERRNGLGFPSNLGPESILMASEIIGISSQLLKLIHEAQSNPQFNLANQLKNSVHPIFSVQVVDAFKKIFESEKA